jgi:hypothetical protein
MAARSRTDEVLIVWPQSVSEERAEECTTSDLLRGTGQRQTDTREELRSAGWFELDHDPQSA